MLECDPLEEAPIFDLRLRKAVRRFGARMVVASSAPTALDGGATEVLPFAPGGAEALLRGLQKALLETGTGAEGAAARNGDGATPAEAGPGEEGGALPGHAELADSWRPTSSTGSRIGPASMRRTCSTPPPC